MQQCRTHCGHLALVAIALTLVLAAVPARGETVTITSPWSSYGEMVNDAEFAGRHLTNPTAATDSITYADRISTTTYTIGDGGFSIDMSHRRPGYGYGYVESNGSIDFIIEPDTPGGVLRYTATGNYEVTDGNSQSPGWVYFSSSLRNIKTGEFLYRNEQSSEFTPNERFTLGESGGDYSNYFGGSLSEELIAGETYQWRYNAQTWLLRDADADTTAAGNFSLTFNDTSAAAVPLPAAAWGGMALFGGLGLNRWRRSRAGAPLT